MQDKVVIEGLAVMTTIGVYDWEQTIKQPLLIDLTMNWNNKPAGSSDDIKDCLDYALVSQAIIDLLTSTRFFLIESVAEEIAKLVLTRFSVEKVKVKVNKPGALREANNVAVIIERER